MGDRLRSDTERAIALARSYRRVRGEGPTLGYQEIDSIILSQGGYYDPFPAEPNSHEAYEDLREATVLGGKLLNGDQDVDMVLYLSQAVSGCVSVDYGRVLLNLLAYARYRPEQLIYHVSELPPELIRDPIWPEEEITMLSLDELLLSPQLKHQAFHVKLYLRMAQQP